MMGRLVAAGACSHILMSPEGVEERARGIVAGIRELGRRIVASKPDLVVVVSSDHMFNVNMSLQAPFCVGVADEYMPFGDMDIPREPRPGHRSFAEAFVAQSARRGFDLAKAEELRPDHGVALPMMLIDPARTLPIVPVLININMEPVPGPARCHALGGVLRETIDKLRPAGERVAVLATGGLSHWLNIPRHGEVSRAFDQEVLGSFVRGHPEQLTRLTPEQIVEQGGNGGLEIVNWLFMAGAAPGWIGDIVYYQEMPEWFTGMGGLELREAA
jgi:2'-aminobiphenyl-2,3-diol 1,2-dioxygenase large subunit